jgi:tetratricopeptide (TPR) repeat protein
MLLRLFLPISCVLIALTSCGREAPNSVEVAGVDPSAAIAAARATLEAGEPVAAAQAAWTLVQAHPDRADARLVLASANVLQGDYAAALIHADVALRLDPGSADAHTNRGAALHGLGRPADALKATESALELQDDHQGALRNAARLHSEAQRWLPERAALEHLGRLRLADAEVRLLLARNRVHAGDLSGAQHAIEASIERAPDNPALHNFAATVAYEMDRLEAAMDHANIALRLDPERRDALLVFEAAFYVRVASVLRCTTGAPPWSDEVVALVLKRYAQQGIGGVERFRAMHARQGSEEDVVTRVKRVGACDD